MCREVIWNRKKRGFIDTWIMFVISIVILTVVFIYLLGYLQPIIKYIKLNQTARKYSLLMEKDGYLSPSNFNKLQEELLQMGFNLSDIAIAATSSKVPFGEEVSIELRYNYRGNRKSMNGLAISNSQVVLPMYVHKSTTSKNGG